MHQRSPRLNLDPRRRILLGIVATETPTSITLRRADGVEDTILRKDLESLRDDPAYKQLVKELKNSRQ